MGITEAQNRKETESGLDRVAPILISAMRMLKTIMIIGMMGCTVVRYWEMNRFQQYLLLEIFQYFSSSMY